MKTVKLILTIISFSLVSCTATKKCNAVKTFLSTQIINAKDQYLLVTPKLKTINTLQVLYGSDEVSIHYDKNKPSLYRSRFLNEKDWIRIYEKHKNDSLIYSWHDDDFNFENLQLNDGVGLYNDAFFDKYRNNKKKIIWLSEPIYYKQKNIVIFTIMKATTSGGTNERTVVIMKKINGKWQVIDYVYDYVF